METLVTRLQDLPEFLSSHDLVTLGLFPSPDSVYLARIRGISPDFLKLGRKVIYPKASVIRFVECRMKKGDLQFSDSGESDDQS